MGDATIATQCMYWSEKIRKIKRVSHGGINGVYNVSWMRGDDAGFHLQKYCPATFIK